MKLSKKVAKITAAITGAVALGTVATATTANADSIYTVQAGDTLSGISYKLGHETNKYNQTKKHQLLNNKYKLHKHKMYNNLVLKHQLAITQM